MRIALLISHWPDPRVMRRIRSLKERGCTVSVLISPRRGVPYGVNVNDVSKVAEVHYQSVRRGVLHRTFWVFGTLRRLAADVVYAMGPEMLLAATAYAIPRRRTRLVYEIADLPGSQVSRLLQGLVWVVEWMAGRRLDVLLMTSPGFWEARYKRLLRGTRRMTNMVVPNVPLLSLREEYSASLPEEYSARASASLALGWIGLVRYPQQIRHLIQVAEEKPEIRVIVAGSAIEPSGQLLKEASARLPNLEYRGEYHYSDIGRLYSEIDVVYAVYDASVRNVRYALPNRLFEAIQCGLPIIVAKNTHVAEFVSRNDIGIAVSHDSWKELCSALDTLRSEEVRRRMQRNALAMRDRYTWEAIERHFAGLVIGDGAEMSTSVD